MAKKKKKTEPKENAIDLLVAENTRVVNILETKMIALEQRLNRLVLNLSTAKMITRNM